MFNHLLNFTYQRNAKEAIGFYISYTFFFFLTFFIIGTFIGILGEIGGHSLDMVQERAFSWGFGVEGILSIAFLLIFLIKKDLPNKIKSFLIGILLSILALFFGFLVVLIPVSFLTTLPSKEKKSIQSEKELELIKKREKNIFWKIIKILSFFLLIVFSLLLIMLLYNIIELFQDLIFLIISDV